MSLQTQRQIRENFAEAQTYLSDLYAWEKDVKRREATRKLGRWSGCPPRRLEMELSAAVKTTPLNDVTSAMSAVSNDSQSDALTQAEERRTRGNAFFRDRNYPRAIALYTESLDLHPTAVSAANRAMAYLKLQKYDKAVRDCDSALELDVGFLKAYQRRSVARKELGDLKGALEDAEMALRLQPTSDAIRTAFSELLEGVLQSENLRIDRRHQPITITPPTDSNHQPELEASPTEELDVVQGQWKPVQELPVERCSVSVKRGDQDEKEAQFSKKDPDEERSSDKELPSVQVEVQANGHRELPSENLSPEPSVEFIPGVPKSWSEFEAAYKSLKRRPDCFRSYLLSLEPVSLPSIFKSSLSVPILVALLEAVINGLDEDTHSGHWLSFLEQLKRVPRFEMLLMCLTQQQKDRLTKCTLALSIELKSIFKSIL